MSIIHDADNLFPAPERNTESIHCNGTFSESSPRLSHRPSSRFTIGSELDSIIYEHNPVPPPSSFTPPIRHDARSSTLASSLSSLQSNRSSATFGSTTFVASKRDRLRYSWQSLQGDESTRPRINIVRIVSETATASSALPGGEALGFSISPQGRRIACYNSARVFILQTAALPVNISQELALKRRPLAVEVNDVGTVLAILADPHTVHVYSLTGNRSKLLKTCKTDYAGLTIALSPTGALLAVAYEDGVEVFSLASSALSTDRRAVRSPRMDKLTFAHDSGTLLGTTTRKHIAATVILSVPIFPSSHDGLASHEELKEAWCTGMLEPQVVDNSSHAIVLRDSDSTAVDKLFAWNSLKDTFGLIGIDDLQYDNADFPLTVNPPLSTVGGLGAAVQSLPTIDERNSSIAMIINDRTVRLYIVPPELRMGDKCEAHSIDHELEEEFGNPFSDVKWVYSHADLPAPRLDTSAVQGRLLVISPGSSTPIGPDEESIQVQEGGRIIIFDFDPQYAGQPGQVYTFTLGKAPPTLLHDEQLDVEAEVALAKHRTMKQTKVNSMVAQSPLLARSASTPGSNCFTPLSHTSPTTPHSTQNPASASQRPSPTAQTHAAVDDRSIPDSGSALMHDFNEYSGSNNDTCNRTLMPTISGATFLFDHEDESYRYQDVVPSSEAEPANAKEHPLAVYERSYIYTSRLGPQVQRPTHLPRALRRAYERAASQATVWAAHDIRGFSQPPLDPSGNLPPSLADELNTLRIKTDQPQGKPPTLLSEGHYDGQRVEVAEDQLGHSSNDGSSGGTPQISTPGDMSAGDVSSKTCDIRFGLSNPVEELFHVPSATSQRRGLDSSPSSRPRAGHRPDGEEGLWPRKRSRSRRPNRVGSRHEGEHVADEAKCVMM